MILHLQGLARPHHKRLGHDGQRGLIEDLGYVQVDSIQWIERAHHMILQSREQAYRPRDLERMAERERSVFEGWTHDACFIPTRFFPFWRHRFRRVRPEMETKFERWQGAGYRDHLQRTLEHIAEVGAVRARDLEKTSAGPKAMWQWDESKAALEFLWRTGALAIRGRDGFQKRYDLAERVIPAEHLDARVSEEAFLDWACRAALERLGIAGPAQIARYFDLVSIAEAKDWLAAQDGQSVREVIVDGRPLVARADIEDLVAEMPDPPARLRTLSPFDPVLRDRARAAWLFGFDYRIEIYVPEAKRRYGYYVHPLLDGDRVAGRIDMRANRKEGTLDVARLWWEPGVRRSRALRDRLDGELERQRRFTGMERVRWTGPREPGEHPA